ncbi:MAG TPA: SGNH/GDSL hydrolase family protein [Vicinamibacterales bacterium]|nr:SGNH/GDSL hydrolase family protein [Vicinamibacterales bacterium]
MGRRASTMVLAAAAFALCVCAGRLSALEASGDRHWVATWSAAHVSGLGPPAHGGFDHRTLRQIVHTSVGGDQVRIRFFAFGPEALHIGAARVALTADGPAIQPDSDRPLTFGGLPTIRVPAGAMVVSDPVDLPLPPLSDLAVSVFVPGPSMPATWHFAALQTSYVSPSGDFTAAVDMPVESTTGAWFWLAGVDVLVPKPTGTIVAFGDSVTDGIGSTPNDNMRWPDHFAARIMSVPGNHDMGVVNGGLTGNRLVHDILGPNGLARFDRDVLTQPGVRHVVVLLGNNDIIFGQLIPADAVTPEQIIQAHRMLIERARVRGLKIYGATLTPFKGALDNALFPAAEAQRQAVNAWIRTSGEYDAVIDFDLAVRDQNDPAQLDPLRRADVLHPNDRGYAAMADAIDLKLFTREDRW